MLTVTLLTVLSAADGAGSAPGTSIVVYLAAAIGAISGITASVVSWRSHKTNATQGYVDQNLAAQQARIDGQEAELVMLRERDVAQRKRISELELDHGQVHKELTALRKECDECLRRVAELENQA